MNANPAQPVPSQQGFGAYPPPSPDGFVPGGISGPPPRRRFPLALVIVAGVVCCMFAGAVLLMVWNGKQNQQAGTFVSDSTGMHYSNPALGIQLSTSADWQHVPSKDSLMLLQKSDCVVSMVDNTVLFSPERFKDGMRQGVVGNYPGAAFGPMAAWHGGGAPSGMTIEVSGNSPLHENWFSLSHRFHLTTLIEVQPPEDATCPNAFADLERGLVLR